MSRHASSLDLMRKSGPHQSASSLLSHLYSNLRHILGNRERSVIDSLEMWAMTLSNIPTPSAVVDASLMQIAQSIDRLGLVLKNVAVSPKVWRSKYQPRASRTDPKIAVEEKGDLSTAYSEGEITTLESNGVQRLYVPGTACGADMYMIFYMYGTAGNSPLHKLYSQIAKYILDLYLLTHEEMEEMSMPGGIELLLVTARAGFSSIKDVKEVARIDAMGAELMLRQGNAFSALKHAMSITGDEYNLERQVATKAAKKLAESVEKLAVAGELEAASKLMERLLNEFPYVSEFHDLQVELIKSMCTQGEFAMAYDTVPKLKKLKHVRAFDKLQDMIETADAEAEQKRLAEEQEAQNEIKKLAVPGYAEARKELGDLALKDNLGDALIQAQNMLPRFKDIPECAAEIEEFIKNLEEVISTSAKSTEHLTLEQLGQRIQEGLQSAPFAEKMAEKIIATQLASPANDQTAEVKADEAPELIERAVMEDGKVTAAPLEEKAPAPTEEVLEAIKDDAEQAELEEATG